MQLWEKEETGWWLEQPEAWLLVIGRESPQDTVVLGQLAFCGKTLVCACACDRIQPPGKGLTRSRQGVLARTSRV